ncbi:MAG: glycosyltransferase [Bacteroidales bacterium]|nr:glycosyltransferase [Bacteroidales bacterium]MBN2758473.1 glycosyltransferase [Bacteroidales bacterium]
MQNLYIIKALAPWMMEELITFSEVSKFKIVFLRKIPEFYKNDVEILKKNGVKIYIRPFDFKLGIKNILFLILFKLKNFDKFIGFQNLIWTIMSMNWFLLLDKKVLKDVKSIHAQFASQAAIIAYFIKKRYKIEYNFTFHAHDIYFKNRWFKTLVKNANKSFSISDYNIAYVNEKYGIAENQITLSRLGVKIPKVDAETIKLKQKCILGFMSNLEEKKGIPFLMEAFKILNKKYPEKFELQIAGSGEDEAFIQEFITENNLLNSIKLLGRIRDEAKIKFYNDINIFVLPSITTKNDMDGIPVVLMEAISYAKPIISTNISGIPEICINNFDGYLIDEKNTEQLVQAIENLCKSSSNYKLFVENSISLANNEYDLVKNSKNKLKEMNW